MAFTYNLLRYPRDVFNISTFYGWRWNRLEIEFYVPDGLNSPSQYLNHKHHVPLKSSSEESFNTIRSWIKTCQDSHSACNDTTLDPVPTRLLDTSGSRIRLIETASSTAETINTLQLAALSHCWGPKHFFVTDRNNIQDNKINIKWGDLTRTFQDAVVITRKLGIQYLWIDSLCIIQNDETDWEREASRMAGIYSNAVITIAATHSKSGFAGIFSTRDVGAVKVLASPDEQCQVFARRKLQHEANPNLPFEEALLTSAWTLQEHLLSRRIVHYCKNEIFWECRIGSACECTPTIEPSAPRLSSTSNKLDRMVTSIGAPLNWGSDSTSKNGLWRGLVEEYTKRRLTKPSDKLPAISSLRKHFVQNQRNYDLPSGSQSLHDETVRHLLWSADATPFRETIRRPERKAPSWSWASLDGDITYDYFQLKSPWNITCHISDHSISTISRSQYIEGTLKIRGQTVTATLCCRTATKYQRGVNSQRDFNGVPLKWTIYLPGVIERNGAERQFDPDESITRSAPIARAHHSIQTSQTRRIFRTLPEVLCLRIATGVAFQMAKRRKEGGPDHDKWTQREEGSIALILSNEDTVPGTYKRIGIAHIDDKSHWFDNAKEMEVEISTKDFRSRIQIGLGVQAARFVGSARLGYGHILNPNFSWPEPFKFSGAKSDNSIHAIIDTFAQYDNDPIPMTPRRLGETMAFCGFAAMPVGTSEIVPDIIEGWINNADMDGFNVTYVSNPESFENVVELLVPVLQE
ncbi:heterokaryon incompatibility protein-domain-containing protein [Leptodontidium sp. MPI-SDFR-AT-0119]|nr:heterokaryon incompatibility protein-domain-containing protein [Leptodontidium sp. MPI-SDFR-AT-0119]